MIEEHIIEKLLPAAFICKNFIVGMQECNYEEYLREVVNSSKYFMQKSKGTTYSAPMNESHGECDCISENYSIDFKLIVSKTAMQGRNLFSSRIIELLHGVTGYGTPKVKTDNPVYKPIQSVRIHAALRHKGVEELKKIRKKSSNISKVENEIISLLNILETKKNILLFFPYDLSIEGKGDIEDVVFLVDKDFKNALNYRSEVVHDYETHFVFISDGNFILSTWDGNRLNYIESIKEENSPIYMKIKDMTTWY